VERKNWILAESWLSVLKAEGTQRVGKRMVRWSESVEGDLKNIGVRNWRRK